MHTHQIILRYLEFLCVLHVLHYAFHTHKRQNYLYVLHYLVYLFLITSYMNKMLFHQYLLFLLIMKLLLRYCNNKMPNPIFFTLWKGCLFFLILKMQMHFFQYVLSSLAKKLFLYYYSKMLHLLLL